MIDLYLAIENKLAEVPELKYIDMVDQDHPDAGDQESCEPTALVKLPPIDWNQQGDDTLHADIVFTVQLTGMSFHSSYKNSPRLNDLKASLAWMHTAKKKLYEDGVEYLNNICLTGEHFTKQGKRYELELTYKAFVEYNMV
ncbi:MAG: hypothetical protein JEZ14_15035 [Marinilabiliaceae bacterium]|nr:hypothetical protein [Marinilabiliaceae bacterium]